MLTAETIKELLDYNPDSGALIWKRRKIDFFKDGNRNSATHVMNSWNKKNAGKPAGSKDNFDSYHKLWIFNKKYKAHRIIWLWMTGEWPDQVDHINGIRDDNRWENLRSVSNAENGRNRVKNSRNKSGYRGVSWSVVKRMWNATIRFEGKKKCLGFFSSKEEAFEAYRLEAVKLGFTERHINA